MSFEKWMLLGLWSICMWGAAYLEWGKVFFIISGMVAMFKNMEEKKSPHELSAYAAFNKDGYGILGTTTSAMLDAQLRHNNDAGTEEEERDVQDKDGFELEEELYKRRRIGANAPCVCGSGKKFKKCCSLKRGDKKAEEEERQWKKEWADL